MQGASPAEASAPAGAVFLSYASQDAEAAKRICDALRSAGIEVWSDQSELRGGDAWDQSNTGRGRPLSGSHVQIASVCSWPGLRRLFARPLRNSASRDSGGPGWLRAAKGIVESLVRLSVLNS
jgi:TIR domain-containing protein